MLRTISAHPWQAIFFTYFCTNIHSYYAKVVLSFSSRSYPQVPIAHNVHTIRVSCLNPIHDHDTLRLFTGTLHSSHPLALWCNAPSRNYFCATEIAESKKGIFLFPLVEMLLSPKGTKPLEEF